MLYTDARDIDFNSYKRLFVIGCSFTHWLWPTWADIIAHEHPHLEYHNFGVPGAGNDYIQTMLSQLERAYHLGEQDLVMIMWSSFHRETIYSLYDPEQNEMADCIISESPKMNFQKTVFNWRSTSDMISQKIVDNSKSHICDPRGYLIKNLAIIDNVTKILQVASYSSAQMMSVAVDAQDQFDTTALPAPIDDIINMYSDINNNMLGDCYYDYAGYVFNQITWEDGDQDYHPRSVQYYNYLKSLNINLSNNTLE